MQESNELWFKILQAKYMDCKGFFFPSTKGSSQFWHELHKVKHLLNIGSFIQYKKMVNIAGFGKIVG
jgi:hypothetical protein